ncbi:MAG: hypothetical protein HY812_05160 [Planctomycetes bacterium]|nr:hypothetical protein [Planctomycetota bacterium]
MSCTRTLALSLPFLALCFAPSFAQAQLCPNATDTFWKNDKLPQVPPGGPLAVTVIAGLCDGEAAAQVTATAAARAASTPSRTSRSTTA